MGTLKELDGVSFRRRITNLVDIDNAIGSRQPDIASSSSQANRFDAQVVKKDLEESSSSNQTNRVAAQVVKKALEECTEEIKVSEDRIKEFHSKSATIQQLTFQILAFIILFHAAIIAVAFNQTTYFDVQAMSIITDLTGIISAVGFFAIIVNAVSTLRLEVRSLREKRRLQIYEKYKRKLLLDGVAFNINEHEEITGKLTFFAVAGAFQRAAFQIFIIIVMCYYYFIGGRSIRTIVSARQSALASAAAAPAPTSAPVQSGTSPAMTWCVAKAGSTDIDLMNGLNFACGPEGGVDCGSILPGGSCFSPDTTVSHASFAYNSYYQNKGRNPSYCYFSGTSIITITDPSYLECSFL